MRRQCSRSTVHPRGPGESPLIRETWSVNTTRNPSARATAENSSGVSITFCPINVHRFQRPAVRNPAGPNECRTSGHVPHLERTVVVDPILGVAKQWNVPGRYPQLMRTRDATRWSLSRLEHDRPAQRRAGCQRQRETVDVKPVDVEPLTGKHWTSSESTASSPPSSARGECVSPGRHVSNLECASPDPSTKYRVSRGHAFIGKQHHLYAGRHRSIGLEYDAAYRRGRDEPDREIHAADFGAQVRP